MNMFILSLGMFGFVYLIIMVLYSFRMVNDLDNYMTMLYDTDTIVDGKSSKLEAALLMTIFNLLIPLDLEIRKCTEYFNK